MKILTEGHKYELENFENKEGQGQIIQFIHKEPTVGVFPLKNELTTIADGTTNEDVLEMLINRMMYLQDKFPCKENACCITHLEEAQMWLEKRTRDRIKRNVEGKHLK
jgi:hypothetical protein